MQNINESLSIRDANFRESSFTNAALANARFDDVNLEGSTFINVKLSDVVFTDVNLTNSSITGAASVNSRFDDVNLEASTFINVNLSGVVFTDVNLTNSSISDANLTGMRINGILVDDMLSAYRSATDANSDRDAQTNFGGAVLYAKNLLRLLSFYQQVLGLKLLSQGNDHAVLVSRAYQLVLVEVPSHIAASIDISTPPRLRAESPAKLIFPTASIAAVRLSAREFCGDVLDPEREWDVGAGRTCDGNDPEGNIFQLRELPRGL